MCIAKALHTNESHLPRFCRQGPLYTCGQPYVALVKGALARAERSRTDWARVHRWPHQPPQPKCRVIGIVVVIMLRVAKAIPPPTLTRPWPTPPTIGVSFVIRFISLFERVLISYSIRGSFVIRLIFLFAVGLKNWPRKVCFQAEINTFCSKTGPAAPDH